MGGVSLRNRAVLGVVIILAMTSCHPLSQSTGYSPVDPTGGAPWHDSARRLTVHPEILSPRAPTARPLKKKKVVPKEELFPAEFNKRTSVSMDETMSVSEVLLTLAEQNGFNTMISPNIKNKKGVILSLRNVPLSHVIKILCKVAGLRYHFEGGTLCIEDDVPYVKVYNVHFLLGTREISQSISTGNEVVGSRPSFIQQGLEDEMKTGSRLDFWHELESALKDLLSMRYDEREPALAANALNKFPAPSMVFPQGNVAPSSGSATLPVNPLTGEIELKPGATVTVGPEGIIPVPEASKPPSAPPLDSLGPSTSTPQGLGPGMQAPLKAPQIEGNALPGTPLDSRPLGKNGREDRARQGTLGSSALGPLPGGSQPSFSNGALPPTPPSGALLGVGELPASQPRVLPSRYTLHRHAGLLAVYATQQQHALVEVYLAKLKRSVTAQVVIEAQILEVRLFDKFSAGINWSALIKHVPFEVKVAPTLGQQGASTFTFERTRKEDVSGGVSKILVDFLRQYGKVKTLSNPHLITLNNQPAVLKVAKNEVFFNVSVQRTLGQNSDFENTTSSINTVPIGLVFIICPSVDPITKEIIVSLQPVISRVVDVVNDPTVSLRNSNVASAVPVVQMRQFDTVLRVREGEVSVIGGLIEHSFDVKKAEVPGLSEIPILGNMFTSHQDENTISELVIIVQARAILSDDQESSEEAETGNAQDLASFAE